MTSALFNGDVHIAGTLTFGSGGGVTLPAGVVQNLQVEEGAKLDASKSESRLRKEYAQVSTAVAAAEIKVIHVAKAAGTVLGFVAGLVAKSLSGATVSFDLKKNGATILTGLVVINDTHANYEVVSGTINTTSYVAEDVFEVAVTVDAGGGTLGDGAFAQAVFDENPS